MLLDYVPDEHYTEDYYVAPLAGVHNAFRFTARPLYSEERDQLSNKANKLDPEAYNVECHKLLAQRIRKWSLVDRGGTAVPITADVVKRLKPELYRKVMMVTFGFAPADLDPEAPTAERERVATSQAGDPLTTLEEADRKN